MQLSYRALPYEYIPYLVETVETPMKARFLGVNYIVRRPAIVPVFSPSLAVRYREIPYLLG